MKYFKPSPLLLTFLVTGNLIILLCSIWYCNVEKKIFVNHKLTQLNSIAEIKIKQVVEWQNERLSDARYLSVSPQINESFGLLISDPLNGKYRQSLYNNLIGMFLNGKYESMVALDRSGHIFFALPANDSSVSKYFRSNIRELHGNRNRISMTDFLLCGKDFSIMQFLVPQYKITGTDSIFSGWLALNIDLEKTLFPSLKSIPVPSESIKITLSPVENDTMRPANIPGLPAGPHHRGTGALAVTLPVPGSKAILEVKIDKKEVFAEFRYHELNIFSIAGFLILLFTTAIFLFRLKHRNELKVLDAERKMILAQLDMLAKFSNEAIIVFTRDQTILQVNDKALELYGYTRQEILGMSADLLRSEKRRAEMHQALEVTVSEGGHRFETIHIMKDGTKFPADVSMRFMELMGSHCFLALVRDITERKQEEEKLKIAIKKAEEYEMLKSAFLSRISHEIRTPLNAIMGFSQILKNSYTDDEQLGKYIDIIMLSGDQLLEITNEMIEVSKLVSGNSNINVSGFSLKALFNELHESLVATENVKIRQGIKLKLDLNHINGEHDFMITDRDKLVQILKNLLNNAFKFTYNGTISFGCRNMGTGIMHFFVSDTGIGIEEDKRGLIFDLFRQGDESFTRQFGGVGLGLTICKELVNLLGGKIWVESRYGKGSVFNFTLPEKATLHHSC